MDLINNVTYDYASFGVIDIMNILQSSKQDYQIKKSSLEQLTMLLFDYQGKRAKILFGEQTGIEDCFTYILNEVLDAFNTAKESLQGKVSALGREHLLFVNECLRFMFYAYIFYNQEASVKGLFAEMKSLLSNKAKDSVAFNKGMTQDKRLLQLLNALVFFSGNQMLRENSLSMIYISVFESAWICTKVSKTPIPNMRQATIVLPDFAQDAIIQLIPYTLQAIRMPMRDDLLLTDEQKLFVESSYKHSQKL